MMCRGHWYLEHRFAKDWTPSDEPCPACGEIKRLPPCPECGRSYGTHLTVTEAVMLLDVETATSNCNRRTCQFTDHKWELPA